MFQQSVNMTSNVECDIFLSVSFTPSRLANAYLSLLSMVANRVAIPLGSLSPAGTGYRVLPLSTKWHSTCPSRPALPTTFKWPMCIGVIGASRKASQRPFAILPQDHTDSLPASPSPAHGSSSPSMHSFSQSSCSSCTPPRRLYLQGSNGVCVAAIRPSVNVCDSRLSMLTWRWSD